jgi:hypothetical protein
MTHLILSLIGCIIAAALLGFIAGWRAGFATCARMMFGNP